jgi:hypothetical protein
VIVLRIGSPLLVPATGGHRIVAPAKRRHDDDRSTAIATSDAHEAEPGRCGGWFSRFPARASVRREAQP